jgi:uncharacterized protein (TIGR03437 family)
MRNGLLCSSSMRRSFRAILALTMLGQAGQAQPPKALVVVNAAGGSAVVAPDSIASAFGRGIGAPTKSALSQPLPTTLGGVSVQSTDSAKASLMHPLFYVAPNQVNFVISAGVARGMATVRILNGDSPAPSVDVQVATIAPGLFTANGAGVGVAAAIAIRRSIATQTDSPIPVFHCDANGCTSAPIDIGGDSQVFLELYGTGIRGRSALSNVSVKIGGVAAPVLFAGPQGQFPGLDQVNIAMPTGLNRHGEQDLVLTVDGITANTVRVNVR